MSTQNRIDRCDSYASTWSLACLWQRSHNVWWWDCRCVLSPSPPRPCPALHCIMWQGDKQKQWPGDQVSEYPEGNAQYVYLVVRLEECFSGVVCIQRLPYWYRQGKDGIFQAFLVSVVRPDGSTSSGPVPGEVHWVVFSVHVYHMFNHFFWVF